MSGEATEKASPQRKKKARESGDWVRSRELLSGVSLLAGLLVLRSAGEHFAEAWKRGYIELLRFAGQSLQSNWDAPHCLQAARLMLAPAVGPVLAVMGASLCAVAAVGFAQSGGLQFNPKSLMPSANRLSPGTHVKQMFSARSVVRLLKSLLPAGAVAWLGWGVVQRATADMPVMSVARLPHTFDDAFGLGVKAATVMVVWSALDYAVEWRAWSQRLRMSKQEMREEIKEAMGNPQVKGKIRQMQRAMRRRKAKVDMSRASVVITNPTHYAIALEFSFETMQAPTVLTKGRDLHALDLREEARWAGVPIIENPPLARSLYRSVEPGHAIPFELYAAIAGILAFLYRQKSEEQMRERQQTQREAPRSVPHAPAVLAMQGFEGGM